MVSRRNWRPRCRKRRDYDQSVRRYLSGLRLVSRTAADRVRAETEL